MNSKEIEKEKKKERKIESEIGKSYFKKSQILIQRRRKFKRIDTRITCKGKNNVKKNKMMTRTKEEKKS